MNQQGSGGRHEATIVAVCRLLVQKFKHHTTLESIKPRPKKLVEIKLWQVGTMTINIISFCYHSRSFKEVCMSST